LKREHRPLLCILGQPSLPKKNKKETNLRMTINP
jgi:hypothetical protein